MMDKIMSKPYVVRERKREKSLGKALFVES